jgi:hypothetical protein
MVWMRCYVASGVGNWRMIPADDYPNDAVEVSVWHLPEYYLVVAHDLAVQISNAGYSCTFIRPRCRATFAPGG